MDYMGREELIEHSCNSIYKLVILASRRSLELADGQPRLVVAEQDIKPSTLALLEVSAGKVSCRKSKKE